MKELSPGARALLEAGRDAEPAPDASDRARVQARLTALLGASAFGAAASQAAAMANLAGSTTAAVSGGASVTATGGAATTGATGAATAGATAAAAATHGLASAGATATLGAAAAGSAATTGWVATLGTKGLAWLGAAALSTAIGTTAVVTRNSAQPDLDERALATAPAQPQQSGGLVASVEAPATRSEPDRTAHTAKSLLRKGDEERERGTSRAAVGGTSPRSSSGSSSARSIRASVDLARAADEPKSAPTAHAPIAPPTSNTRAGSSDHPSVESAVSPARLAAMAKAPAAARPEAPAEALAGAEIEAAEELLPQPTDPDVMKAVAAKPREPEPSRQLPAATATVPTHALNPGAMQIPRDVGARPEHGAAVTPGAGSPSAHAPAQSRSPQTTGALSQELQLLARAQRALHDGDLAVALALLDQHGAEHSQGSLREERMAARAVVLCRMHRLDAGLAEGRRLAANTPRSPLLAWVQSVCKR